MTEGLESIVDALPDKRRYTSKSILKLTPKKDHHNTTFTCQAQNTAERTHRSAKLKLEVRIKIFFTRIIKNNQNETLDLD